jgi:hypothetical protein
LILPYAQENCRTVAKYNVDPPCQSTINSITGDPNVDHPLISGDVISEGANVNLFAEACLLGFGFECLDLIAKRLVASFVLPFGFWWQWFANVWQATEFEAQFAGGEASTSGGVLLLRQILRSVAVATGVITVTTE